MRPLVGNMTIDAKFFQDMFLEHLPSFIQTIMVAMSDDFDVAKLASMALSQLVAAPSSELRPHQQTPRLESTWTEHPGNSSGRTFYGCDTKSGRRFMVEPGAQLSVIPLPPTERRFPNPGFLLQLLTPPLSLLLDLAEFEHMLQKNIYRKSDSPWASSLHMVPKATSGDYRALNNVTISDCYAVPLLQDFASILFGKSVFSKIDLVRAFQQIPIARKKFQRRPSPSHLASSNALAAFGKVKTALGDATLFTHSVPDAPI
ncbi:unnamed protein product [Dibothriocephalus latus]|uniref:Reverse transcriptase domain-containing protein n=1 Tax=Dibothriocephalus latus TaxID=60516 RepID=A0A3P7LHH4_DIBLA|nr:unnamed protein product [Dibothriocephalus latus]